MDIGFFVVFHVRNIIMFFLQKARDICVFYLNMIFVFFYIIFIINNLCVLNIFQILLDIGRVFIYKDLSEKFTKKS